MAAIEAVEGYKPYDDAPLQSKVQALELELKAAKERQLATADTLVRLSEAMTDAVALSRESQATAKSAVANAESVNREVQTRLDSVKTELKSTSDQLRNEMAGLKKATVNPLAK